MDYTVLPTSTQDHHSTHKARGKAQQNNFSYMYVSHLDVLSHTSMHVQCKIIAVLRHLPLSKTTIVADSLSIQQVSGYNTSCMHGSIVAKFMRDRDNV